MQTRDTNTWTLLDVIHSLNPFTLTITTKYLLELIFFPEATRFLYGPTAVIPPPPTHTLLNPLPQLWHQAFACEFSAVCALNRPYQEQTIPEGVTLTEFIEWEIKALFINTWIIQRHFNDICWKISSRGF